MPVEPTLPIDRRLALIREAFDHSIVVEQADAAILGSAEGRPEIRRTELVADGFEIDVDAPEGGILTVNVPYLPFWTGIADGRPVDIVPANMVQMAVRLPPGTHHLTLRYARPLLRDRLLEWLRKG